MFLAQKNAGHICDRRSFYGKKLPYHIFSNDIIVKDALLNNNGKLNSFIDNISIYV